MAAVSEEAVSAAEGFVAVAASSVQCEGDTCSPPGELVHGAAETEVDTTGAATGVIMIADFLMMSSS
jgi:hypothetical protein